MGALGFLLQYQIILVCRGTSLSWELEWWRAVKLHWPTTTRLLKKVRMYKA